MTGLNTLDFFVRIYCGYTKNMKSRIKGACANMSQQIVILSQKQSK